MSLPIFQTDNKDFSLMQTQWAATLNPVIQKAFNQGIELKNIRLEVGVNNINHKLGRKLQGWIVTRMKNNFVELYDLQDSNQMPDKILILNSSSVGHIDLLVF